ncbi:hypothetical protein LOTGIDRAFT_110617 [Lottia gigantea]|uniref:(S)-2-hydroxy-acid oxidase n=1 Tax=Lottia gigantea TaxID=225164 RepID=V4AFJ2_LOTGI|nr:hypothetical protein LOTGIDRAFT_110617 [Lottia gigantea]ESP02804.1 hypothetical protein LOTGIDRAFT_110617 [Lottia gigantea]
MSETLVTVADFEKLAAAKLSKSVREYFNSGANYNQTYEDNCNAFKRYRLRPRYMRDVSNFDFSTTIQGHRVASPLGISSMAQCKLAHPDGEIGLAKAADSVNCCFSLASMATTSMDEIRTAVPDGLHFFQIFILKDRGLLLELISEAERKGFKGLVITIDCVVLGYRPSEIKNKDALQPHLELVYISIKMEASSRLESFKNFVSDTFDSSQTWKDIAWLKTVTKLPIITKGVLNKEDAIEALQSGVDGIWVSNHGGRNLDTVPATVSHSFQIDVVSEIIKVVNGRCEVYLDGGIRSGLDVMKALAMGVTAVFVGRPILWGLVCDGKTGAEKVLRILNQELKIGMMLSGKK